MSRRVAIGAFLGALAGAVAATSSMAAAQAMVPAATLSANADLLWTVYVAAVSALPVWAATGGAVARITRRPERPT